MQAPVPVLGQGYEGKLSEQLVDKQWRGGRLYGKTQAPAPVLEQEYGGKLCEQIVGKQLRGELLYG